MVSQIRPLSAQTRIHLAAAVTSGALMSGFFSCFSIYLRARRRCSGGASPSPDVWLHSSLLVAVSAWVFPGRSRFLPQSEHMNVRLIGSSNLPAGTRLRGLSARSPTVTPFDD